MAECYRGTARRNLRITLYEMRLRTSSYREETIAEDTLYLLSGKERYPYTQRYYARNGSIWTRVTMVRIVQPRR